MVNLLPTRIVYERRGRYLNVNSSTDQYSGDVCFVSLAAFLLVAGRNSTSGEKKAMGKRFDDE